MHSMLRWFPWKAILSYLNISFLGLLTLLAISIFAVRKIFKPPHLSNPSDGQRWHLPHGPYGWPIIGNLAEYLTARRDEVEFRDYLSSLSQYGEMTTLHMGSKTWILLNSNRVVKEIIAKKSSMTHDRPEMPIASGLVSHGNRLALLQTRWLMEARHMTSQIVGEAALKTYGEWQEIESVQLLALYLFQPRHWYDHHYRYFASAFYRIVFGAPLPEYSQELRDLRRITSEFLRLIGASVVDFFPRLDDLPAILQPWRKYYADIGQNHYECFCAWWQPVKKAIAAGTAPPSFTRDVLLHPDSKYTGSDEQAMYLATSLLSAGSDNPRMVMNCFVMSTLSCAEAFQRARAEIDHVCNDNSMRLPTVDDMEVMPYFCALMKEVLRWRPVVPLVPPHELAHDLEFEGYTFPAGTNFVINGIAVSRDFEEPEEFRPERWLDGKEVSITHGLWQFGGGRRQCIGYKLAQRGLFVALARLVYCFDFTAAGLIDSRRLRHGTADEPFPVQVHVRSEVHGRLIVAEANRLGFLSEL